MNKKLFDIAFVAVGLVIFSSIFGLNMFNEHPIYWLFLIGVIMIITSVVSLPFTSMAEGVSSTSTGVVLIGIAFVVGVIYTHVHGYPPPGYPPLTNIELAKKCGTAEWVIAINYQDAYSVGHSEEFRFTGTTEKSEEYQIKITNRWKMNHPKFEVASVEKTLTYIPEPYSKIHAYEKNHDQCPTDE